MIKAELVIDLMLDTEVDVEEMGRRLHDVLAELLSSDQAKQVLKDKLNSTPISASVGIKTSEPDPEEAALAALFSATMAGLVESGKEDIAAELVQKIFGSDEVEVSHRVSGRKKEDGDKTIPDNVTPIKPRTVH